MRFGPPLAAIYLQNRDQSNSDYRELELVFEGRIAPDDVLVDVGCGAGRVINQWLRMGLTNRIYGLELDPAVGASTRRRLRRRPNVTIVTGDAIDNLPADGTVFFLFNPFDEAPTQRFAETILGVADASDHPVTVLYLNCKHVGLFLAEPRFSVEVVSPGRRGSIDCQDFAVIEVGRAASH